MERDLWKLNMELCLDVQKTSIVSLSDALTAIQSFTFSNGVNSYDLRAQNDQLKACRRRLDRSK